MKPISYYIKTSNGTIFRDVQKTCFANGILWPGYKSSRVDVLCKGNHESFQVIVLDFKNSQITRTSIKNLEQDISNTFNIEITLSVLQAHFAGILSLPLLGDI